MKHMHDVIVEAKSKIAVLIDEEIKFILKG